jgi:hypothetical protein
MDESTLVVAATFATGAEARMARGALESAGIYVELVADSAGGMEPNLAWASGGFKLLVREEDLVAAREALEPQG